MAVRQAFENVRSCTKTNKLMIRWPAQRKVFLDHAISILKFTVSTCRNSQYNKILQLVLRVSIKGVPTASCRETLK